MPHEELAFARTFINTLQDAVVVLDADLNIQAANRAFFAVFGLTEAHTIGVRLPDLGDGQWDQHVLHDLLHSVVAEDRVIRDFRLKFSGAHGGEQILQLDACRWLYDGQPWAVLTIENITGRLSDTQEMERLNAELARSNEELERFAFLAAHDLQAPLQTIISYLQLLVERYEHKLGADADDFFQFTINSATHLQNMTRGLLALARVNHEKPRFSPVDCQEAVDNALSNLSSAMQACGASISTDPLPTVRGDRAQLVQLFQNLIDNAIKFRGEKPPEIHIGVEERDGTWVFSVQDDGVGIEPDHVEGIFELFRRAHRQNEFEGSGIGLTIARKIVEHHGGRIWVESTPDERTVFYFSIAKQPGQNTHQKE